MTIEAKPKNTETKGETKISPIENNNQVDSKLELLKYTAEVQSRINDQISTDFVLAKLTQKDKEAIIEMTNNAYLAKKTAEIIAKLGKKWTWNKTKQKWESNKLNEDEVKLIQEQGEMMFDSLMRRTYMTTILNRNVESNYLIRILAGLEETPDTIPQEQEPTTLMQKIKNKVKRKEDEDEPNFD